MAITITSTILTADRIQLGSSFSRAQATTREILEIVTNPDGAEVSYTMNFGAGGAIATLWFHYQVNPGNTPDNNLLIGFATGVYVLEIRPGESFSYPITGKPTSVQIFTQFADQVGGGGSGVGGTFRYGAWD